MIFTIDYYESEVKEIEVRGRVKSCPLNKFILERDLNFYSNPLNKEDQNATQT